ncbi:SRPBCC family protein [Pseudoalteromonas sp. B62]|uniref:SRPBCC family protein n=1 Tax=Pseudoalteromonas sp. B62 TaxID=630483 RepID=UPI00301D7069
MILINLKQNLAAPPTEIINVLLDHERLNRFFNAQFLLLKPQNCGQISGGKGAVRQVRTSGYTFTEQVISASDNHICYQIVGNKPVAAHQGDIYLTVIEKQAFISTELTYSIQCISPWWMPSFILKFFIKKDIKNALTKLERYFKECTT